MASVWQAVIKYELGKLPLPSPAAEYLPRQRERHRIDSLAIEEGALTRLAQLLPLHRDPFDGMLVTQALQQNLTLVTVDDAVKEYPATFLPA